MNTGNLDNSIFYIENISLKFDKYLRFSCIYDIIITNTKVKRWQNIWEDSTR